MAAHLISIAIGFLLFASDSSSQSLTASSSRTFVSLGGFVDFSLVSFDVGTGNVTLSEITGGYLPPSLNDVVPLTIWNATGSALFVYGGIASESPLFSGRVATPLSRVMRISNVSFADGGNRFVFRMTYRNLISRTSTSETFQLTITVAPVAIPPLLNGTMTVVEGGNVTVSCSFSGLPIVSLNWTDSSMRGSIGTKTSDQSSPARSVQSLTVTNIKVNESGIFGCTATNEGGQANQTTFVSVQYKPVISTFTPLNILPMEGELIRLVCTAAGNPPPASYHFHLNGQHLTTSSSNLLSLTATNCTTSTGTYSCMSENSIGNSSAALYNLTVGGKPMIYNGPVNTTLNENSSLELSCDAVGCPEPNITWSKKNDPGFLAAGNLLVLSNLTRNDTTEFTCTATNVHGVMKKSASVNVHYAPEVNPQVVPPVISACPGNEIMIPCEAYGNPMPGVNLTNSLGVVLATSSEGKTSYSVTVAQNTFGTFLCSAWNAIGTDTKPVKVARRAIASEPQNVTVISGAPNSLTVTWFLPLCIPASGVSSFTVYVTNPVSGVQANHTATCSQDPCGMTITNLTANVAFALSLAAVDGSGMIGDTSMPQSKLPLQAVSRCHPNPCLNGGQCTEHNVTFSCVCSHQFKGSYCEAAKLSDDDDKTIMIASIVGGSVLFLVLLLIVCCCCCRKRKTKDIEESKPEYRGSEKRSKGPITFYANAVTQTAANSIAMNEKNGNEENGNKQPPQKAKRKITWSDCQIIPEDTNDYADIDQKNVNHGADEDEDEAKRQLQFNGTTHPAGDPTFYTQKLEREDSHVDDVEGDEEDADYDYPDAQQNKAYED